MKFNKNAYNVKQKGRAHAQPFSIATKKNYQYYYEYTRPAVFATVNSVKIIL